MSIKNEISFHNKRFKNGLDTRAFLKGIYAITFNSKEYFNFLLNNHVKKNVNILELGCGNGAENAINNTDICEVYGVDVSSEAIRQAKNLANKNNININLRIEIVLPQVGGGSDQPTVPLTFIWQVLNALPLIFP
jgi:2-polyprenyl-3-methyl-5-hydroxy-6-metoxy-1,4-benzoquinol methylase